MPRLGTCQKTADAIVNRVGRAQDAHSDHGQPGRLSLGHNQPKCVGLGGENENVGIAVEHRELPLVADDAREVDVAGQIQSCGRHPDRIFLRPLAAKHQLGIESPAQVVEHWHQKVDRLLSPDPTDVQDHLRSVRDPDPPAYRTRSPCLREHLVIDSNGDHPDGRSDPIGLENRNHRSRVRDHEVTTICNLPAAHRDRALPHGGSPARAVQAGVSGVKGVVREHRRHPSIPGQAQAQVGGGERRVDMDDVEIQSPQPRADPTRRFPYRAVAKRGELERERPQSENVVLNPHAGPLALPGDNQHGTMAVNLEVSSQAVQEGDRAIDRREVGIPEMCDSHCANLGRDRSAGSPSRV